jgi:7-carboxy-7-deazaguanine synthase
MALDEVMRSVGEHPVGLAMVTGGEPLVQDETPQLVQMLIDEGYTALVETNGSLDIGVLPEEAVRIVDMKCPGSGMADRMHLSNLHKVRESDEVKFVVSSKEDYLWAKEMVLTHTLPGRTTVLFSPAQGMLDLRELAEWIIEDHLDCKLQLQLHKIIWPERRRGV